MRKRLQNPEIAAGYREMDAEPELMHAIDAVRKQQQISDGEGPIKVATDLTQ